MTYWDRLGMTTQAVLLQAAVELEETELDPWPVIEKRRLLLLSSAYAPCPHYRNGHY